MPKRKGRVRLIIEFEDKAKLVEFVDSLKGNVFPEDVCAYRTDALDNLKPTQEFILRRAGQRPESYLVKEQ